MTTAIEKKCPQCYRKLPDPEFQLDYFLWTPGFEWIPEKESEVEEDDETEEEESAVNDEDMEEALAEMVEESEMKNEFNAIAKSGYLDVDTAAVLARKLGLSPSDNDVRMFQEENGPSISYSVFHKFMALCTHPEDDAETMGNFFAQYDTIGSGFLTKKQVHNLLTTWGEPLSDEEFDAFVADFSLGDKIEYKTLCDRIMLKK